MLCQLEAQVLEPTSVTLFCLNSQVIFALKQAFVCRVIPFSSAINVRSSCAGINKSLEHSGGERQSHTSIALKLLGQVRARIALSLILFIKIIFSSCISIVRSKAVQFSHKRLYSVFNIARTTYTNRYILIIWKHLFKSIALIQETFEVH